MKRFAKSGDRLYKCAEFKIFFPDGTRRSYFMRAPNGQGYTADTIENNLVKIGLRLERAFPDHEFHIAPLSPTKFNFVCTGPKSPELFDSSIGQTAQGELTQ